MDTSTAIVLGYLVVSLSLVGSAASQTFGKAMKRIEEVKAKSLELTKQQENKTLQLPPLDTSDYEKLVIESKKLAGDARLARQLANEAKNKTAELVSRIEQSKRGIEFQLKQRIGKEDEFKNKVNEILVEAKEDNPEWKDVLDELRKFPMPKEFSKDVAELNAIIDRMEEMKLLNDEADKESRELLDQKRRNKEAVIQKKLKKYIENPASYVIPDAKEMANELFLLENELFDAKEKESKFVEANAMSTAMNKQAQYARDIADLKEKNKREEQDRKDTRELALLKASKPTYYGYPPYPPAPGTTQPPRYYGGEMTEEERNRLAAQQPNEQYQPEQPPQPEFQEQFQPEPQQSEFQSQPVIYNSLEEQPPSPIDFMHFAAILYAIKLLRALIYRRWIHLDGVLTAKHFLIDAVATTVLFAVFIGLGFIQSSVDFIEPIVVDIGFTIIVNVVLTVLMREVSIKRQMDYTALYSNLVTANVAIPYFLTTI
jgi:hypothetical protein